MHLIVAVILAAVLYGLPLACLASWLSSRAWSRPAQLGTLLLAVVAIWVPSGYLAASVSEVIPLDWGHAGIGLLVGYVLGSALSAVVITAWLVRETSSNNVFKGRRA